MLKACRADEVEIDDTYQVVFDDRPPIAIYNVGGTFYATDDTCTHGDASLADGLLEGCAIECPFHAGTFDVRTGKALTRPCVEPVRAYPVKVEDGVIYVLVDESLPVE